ncbi:MAG TPA: queuosine precursor transporter [Cyclobacteriaceae bacterium]|nr:queuosine precursor transporter [Cyclobacteriaceae bacterium]
MESISLKDHKKILICLTLYITSLFASNTIGLKIMPFIFGSHLSVGVFCFPIVFIMTDVIGEVYGKKMAKQFVLAGAISILLFLFYSFISAIVPWAKEGLWVKDAWNQIFGLTARISIASLSAFAFAEYQDVISFFFFKKYTGQKHFWIRSNLSNLWSQLLDTVIFMTIAFAGVYPTHTLINLIISWWLFKVVMGLLYTPLSYLGIYLLRNRDEVTQIKTA